MAKNRKKEKKGAVSMDISVDNQNTGGTPQAMDISEGTVSNSSLASGARKVKKSTPMKRSKNLRKRKALERAISKVEKSEEKVSKKTDKKLKIQSAKTLYD